MTSLRSLLMTAACCAWVVGLGPGVAAGQGTMQKEMQMPAKEMPAGMKGQLQFPILCPKGYERQVDKVGQEDRCHKTVGVNCGEVAGRPNTIYRDSDGELDTCARPPLWPASLPVPPPTCPQFFHKIVKRGWDVCERSMKPGCRAGSTLQVKAGADVCGN